jgi:hypothetical protein
VRIGTPSGSFTRLAVVAAALALAGGLAAAGPAAASVRRASAADQPAAARPALPDGQRYVCPQATQPGQMECMAIVKSLPGGVAPATTNASFGNYGPAQLQSAYKLVRAASRKGKGVTVAIVDAYRNPKAASDLSHYRSHFHLKPCTTASKCLRIVNESGKASPLPSTDPGWGLEESLDLDMVSAICPNCRILLVEASSPFTSDLGRAEDTAIRLGARYVSNSWSGNEFYGQDYANAFFNHPGDVVAFAAGDHGYAAQYPADLQYVTAVGGTTLTHARNRRGWQESAWGVAPPGSEGTGSGCSAFEPKPSWQRADASYLTGCLNRTEVDVSADANPNTGVLVYDTFQQYPSGFEEVGGTSEATPIITATYALAGTPSRGSYPAEYPYLHTGHLFDVTSGQNGTCEKDRRYLCHGTKGFDGPTGLGTPDGTGAFTNGTTHRVALVDPGTQDVTARSKFSLTIIGLDTSHATGLKWSATGLPRGLSIHAVSHSTNGKITGRLPATPGTFEVKVTGKDGRVTGTTHFAIVSLPPLTVPVASTGPIVAGMNLCLDNTSGTTVKVEPCVSRPGVPASQRWTQAGSGQIESASGKCLAATGFLARTVVKLETCNTGNGLQFWSAGPSGELQNDVVNPAGIPYNMCLADPGSTRAVAFPASGGKGTQVEQDQCYGYAGEIWTLG